MDISIIIPMQISNIHFLAYLTNLSYCLEAIKKQSVLPEIVIVDYMSSPYYREKINSLAKKFDCSYTYEENKDPLWARGRALNAGAHVASGTGLLFVDADCVLPPTYVEAHSSALAEKNFTYSKFYSTKPTIVKSSMYEDLLTQVDQLIPPIETCCSHIGILKSVFDFIGGYDNEYRGWGSEDNDLYFRLSTSGFTPLLIPTNPIHLWHPSWQEMMDSDGKHAIQRGTRVSNRNKFSAKQNKGK